MITVTTTCDVGCSHCEDLDRLAQLSGLMEKAPQYDLRAKYDAFNEQFYDSKLPSDIKLEWFVSKKMGGVCTCQLEPPKGVTIARGADARKKYFGYTMYPGSLKIKISTLYKRSEQALDGILLHEMTHAMFYVQGDFDEQHGAKFVAFIKDLSTKLGYEVPLRDDTSGLEVADDKVKPVGVIFVGRRDGGMSMIICPPNTVSQAADRIIAFWQARPQFCNRVTGFVVMDPEWSKIAAQYPVVRKLDSKNQKLYKLPPEDIIKRIGPTTASMMFNTPIEMPEQNHMHNALGDDE